MDAERARAYLLKLPHVVETVQWGGSLVYWVGDKAIGGKMFTLMRLESDNRHVISFAAGAEHAAELCEREGLVPAPYLARAGWVAAERWDALAAREWQAELVSAHEVVITKLPKRTRDTLELPRKQQAALIAERRRLLADKA